jgi:hypothetical protein
MVYKSIQEIIEDVELHYKLQPGQLVEKCRTKTVAKARKVAYALCRTYGDASYSEIADAFHRHHSTIVKVLAGPPEPDVRIFEINYGGSKLIRMWKAWSK